MRFIGELFNVRLIPPKIVITCVVELLQIDQKLDFSNGFDSSKIPHPDEDKIEGACILLTIGGSKLERPKLVGHLNKLFIVLEALK